MVRGLDRHEVYWNRSRIERSFAVLALVLEYKGAAGRLLL